MGNLSRECDEKVGVMFLDLYFHLDDSMEDYIEMVTSLIDMFDSEDLATLGIPPHTAHHRTPSLCSYT